MSAAVPIMPRPMPIRPIIPYVPHTQPRLSSSTEQRDEHPKRDDGPGIGSVLVLTAVILICGLVVAKLLIWDLEGRGR